MLKAISPIDGRYADKTTSLVPFFSEMALICYRVQVEVEYFIALCELPLPQLADFPKERYADLRKLYQNFTEEEALKVKEIEQTTNHDVKAVEYFIKEAFDYLYKYKGIAFIKEHYDIEHTLSMDDAIDDIIMICRNNGGNL